MEKYEKHQLGENVKDPVKINRRTFIKGGIAAGVSVWGSGMLLATQQKAFAQTPKYGGRLKFAIPDSPLTFDPCFWVTYTERWMCYILYNGLTYLTPDLKVVPGLAESWEPKDNGKAWIFHLRKGVRFHNGRELKAKDVADYFNRVMDPKTGSSVVKTLSPLKNAEIMNEYTVRINLSSRYVDFPITVSNPLASIIAPESAGRDTKIPIGTGPFKFKEFIPGEKVVFEKNPNYWKKGLPYLDTIEWINIPDPATQVSAIASGEIDTFPEMSKDFIDVLKKNKNVVVEEIPTGAHQPIVMQLDKKPFDDPRVVMAIKLCLDRQKFVDLVLDGHGVPANDVSVPPNDPFYHGVPIRKQNYKLAKKLLSHAGYENGLDLELYSSTVRVGMMPSALTLKDMCEPAGIRINVKSWPPETYWKEVWRNKPFCVSNWVGRPNIHEYLHQFFHQNSFNQENPGGTRDTFNTSHYINPTVSSLLDEGMAELDNQKRLEIYKMAQAIIMETAGWITPYNANYIRARRVDLQNYAIHPMKWCDLAVSWKSS